MIAVMGTARFASGEIERLNDVMTAMMTATRAEDGCMQYVYSRAIGAPDTLIISELWRDDVALAAHFKTPHMATLNAALGTAKVLSLSVKKYAITSVTQLMGAD